MQALREKASAQVLPNGAYGYFLAKPHDIERKDYTPFCGRQVIEGLHTAMNSLAGAWWGLLDTNQIDLLEVIEDLEKRQTDECPNPGAAVICTDEDSENYLFSLVTSHAQFYKVSFSIFGFRLHPMDIKLERPFREMSDLLDYARNVEKITFVNRPFQTLKELCGDVLIRHKLENNPKIPPLIKTYVNKKADKKHMGVRKTKFIDRSRSSFPWVRFRVRRP
ncbi:hypothetical protein WMY93_011370 [Mugilogobius chulae]|uniref:Uncharacterized protein n=1 Tax=Mugilogobius chulae TaxID=88201 RepID=A0AAW0PBB8_9GOBI